MKFLNHIIQSLTIIVLILFSVQTNAKAPALTKKQLSVAPAKVIRMCCGFGVDIGIEGVPFVKKTDITSRSVMGSHTYMGGKSEVNGIIYTYRGGFIDLGHMRDWADWTAYLYNLIKTSQTDPKFAHIDLRNEGGEKSLDLLVPKDLDEETIIQVAGKIAYDLALWHEISSWFGASYIPFIPEKFSSFSPEDMYSNLMGVHLGIRAIKSNLEYNEAMTIETSNMLDTLESVTTEKETYDAMAKVNKIWYTNEKKYPSNKITLKRYIELDANLLPWLVPGYESQLPPYPLQKPDDSLSKYYKLSLVLSYSIPVDSIFPGRKVREVTQNDFDTFVNYIKTEIQREEVLKEQKELSKEVKSEKGKNNTN